MGTHKNWFKSWHFDRAAGKLWHDSGLVFWVKSETDGVSADVDKTTLNAFYDFELARGVKNEQINSRLMRLNKEVQLFLEHDNS